MNFQEKIYYVPSIEANQKKLERVHDISSLALGVGSGLLGLESLNGFLFYFIGMTLTNIAFYSICCERNTNLFFKSTIQEVFLSSIFSGVAGYIMMWCLVYALVK